VNSYSLSWGLFLAMIGLTTVIAIASLRNWAVSRDQLLVRSERVKVGQSLSDVIFLLGRPNAGPFPSPVGRTVFCWGSRGNDPARRTSLRERLGFGEPPTANNPYPVEIHFDQAMKVQIILGGTASR